MGRILWLMGGSVVFRCGFREEGWGEEAWMEVILLRAKMQLHLLPGYFAISCDT